MNIFKNGCWGSYRHQFLNEAHNFIFIPPFPEELFTTPKNAYVDVLTPGDFSSLQWIQLPGEPKSGEKYTVHYSSLNFRDIMLASGKMPRGSLPGKIMISSVENLAHKECLIGIEFAGHNSEGKRVMGIVGSQGLACHIFAEPCFLFDVPDSWTLEDAATVPLAYCSVFYALVVRGQVKAGESILIHSGSGGVGQAAIAVALSYGCKIYTTVGGYIVTFNVLSTTEKTEITYPSTTTPHQAYFNIFYLLEFHFLHRNAGETKLSHAEISNVN
ncbi:Fatty acid synthase [Holothuria leucospilota]|uniref:Fatty acid synthase n=1 Tax=Holothuria leucospilota TaxID=206669 RepID=A0A9Q1BNP7_HOLLE|nr:Fatty acid synthase [Holothuria leucospilota]